MLIFYATTLFTEIRSKCFLQKGVTPCSGLKAPIRCKRQYAIRLRMEKQRNVARPCPYAGASTGRRMAGQAGSLRRSNACFRYSLQRKQDMKRALLWSASWLCLTAFYVLLVGQIKGAEVAAGLLSGALASAAYTATKSRGNLGFAFRIAWLAHLRNLPGQVLADTGCVFGALWNLIIHRKPIRGRFLAIPFDFGGQEATSAARRALVTAAASLAPNAYVVAVDEKEGLLLLHQLVATPEPPGKGDREWPL